MLTLRELVQLGSTLALGARGHRFKSCILDHDNDDTIIRQKTLTAKITTNLMFNLFNRYLFRVLYTLDAHSKLKIYNLWNYFSV